MYGPEGVGKSTFGAGAPSPIFLGAEEGTAQLDVTRFPAPETWADALDALRVLTVETHDFKTLVVDTLDWLEPILWEHMYKRDGQTSIEGYGYGKGYTAALDEWRIFLAGLERLRKAKPMHVVLLAHSWIKPFKNPTGDDFDRYELKLNPKAAGLLKEWSDAVLFADYETFAVTDARKRVRGVDNNGARIVHTERRAAFDAKNRYSLPESMPLDWDEFAKAVEEHRPADPAALVSEITRKAKALGGKGEAETLASLKRVGQDAVKLAQLNNWVTSKVASKEEE